MTQSNLNSQAIEPLPFAYKGNSVRTVVIDHQPWFVLPDVCKVLGLSTPSRVAERLDEDEKGVSLIHTLGGRQRVRVINESGLYTAIMRSEKPQAKPFRKWVTAEVLPAIRKTGGYQLPAAEQEMSAPTSASLAELAQTSDLQGLAALKHIVEEFEQTSGRISKVERQLEAAPISLYPQHESKIYALCRQLGHVHPRGFGGAYGQFKEAFGAQGAPLARYNSLPISRFDDAVQWLEMQIRVYQSQQ